MEEPPRQPAGRNNTAHLKSFFTCHRCNTRPMPGVGPMMGHIHAKRHRNMLASLDEQERQEQLELDRRFFAIAKQIQQPRTKQGAYKRKTSPHEDSNHNKGHQLKRARLSSSSSWRCEMCAIAFTGRAPFVQHVLGKKHKTAVGEWLSQGKTVPEHCLPARYLSPPLGSLSPSSSASTSPSASRSSSFGEQEGKNAEGVEEGEELPPLLKVKAEPIEGGNSAISEALSTSEATRAIKQEEEECQPTVQASVPSPWPVQPPSTITNKPLGADVQNEQPNNTEQLDPGSENQYVHEHKSNQTSSLLLEIPSAPTSSASSSAATTSSSSSASSSCSSSASSSCSSSASASPTASASSAPSASSAATAASSPSPTNPAFFCKICQVGCNTALDFLIHENGKRHSKAFTVNKLQSWTEGQKEQLPEEETLYCKVCKKQFLQLEVLNDHRQGKKHQSKLSMAKQKALMQLPPSHFIRRRLVADSSQMQTLFKELPLDYLRSLVDEYEQQQQHNATPNQPAPTSHPSIPFSLAQTQFASLFSTTPPIPLPSNSIPPPSSSLFPLPLLHHLLTTHLFSNNNTNNEHNNKLKRSYHLNYRYHNFHLLLHTLQHQTLTPIPHQQQHRRRRC
ncbi:Peptidoglycan-binding domain 1 protein [Balamuthia mandrillaris]